MKSIETQSVSIPNTKASPGRKSANGRLYGSGDIGIIFSNMDTNDQNEWNPIINDLVADKYMVVTYDYPEHMDDQSGTVEDAILFIGDLGAKKIILIGASRGGVASIKVAARHVNNDSIAGVVAFAAPIEYAGTVFYSRGELKGIKVPKLLINSEYDGWVNDSRTMFDIFSEPKELLIYPGYAHGTELLYKERKSIIMKLQNFIESAITIYETKGSDLHI